MKKDFNKAVEARRRARAVAAKPAATRSIPDKRNKPEKHKKKDWD